MRSPGSSEVEMVLGGGVLPARIPADEAEWVTLARDHVARTRELHGIDVDTLVLERSMFLPLAHIGASDKYSVSFRQRVEGLDVRGGSVNVLCEATGRPLAIQTTAVTGLAGFDASPALAAETALGLAARAFAVEQGLPATTIGAAVLEVARVPTAATIRARLVWSFELRRADADTVPLGRRYSIDARTGEVVGSESTVHEFEVRGNVRALATPGLGPDTAAFPEVAIPMRHLRVTSSAGNATTDANGDFVIPGVDTSLAVTLAFVGPFNNVDNAAGAEYTLTQTIPANTSNTLTLNPTSATQVTAQANVFHHVNVQRDWIRAINPADSQADFVHTAHVNLAQTCNAYYDGGSTNYFLAGGSCPNTAYSSVVAHENGHWLNDRYGTYNGMDGMGEGNADVFSMYLYDDPIVGLNFCGTGCHVRSGLNTRPFCGDFSPSCYGEVHADGEVWMGAAWKMRARLNTALGNTAGDLVADTLFLAWMNGFNQGQIRSIIETQWLLLDDDDGDLNNGSPHYAHIDGGMRDQGFPGVALHPITIDALDVPLDSTTESGPYDASFSIVQHEIGGTIGAVVFHWRANGGAWTQQVLSAQGANVWRGTIPNLGAPLQAHYYLVAADNHGNTLTFPEAGASAPAGFRVGGVSSLFLETFESGPNGWTHGTYGDTSNLSDDWQFGSPGGQSGSAAQGTTFLSWSDPSAAFSGTNVFGTDLGVGANGSYGPNMHTWLRSPIFDCSGQYGIKLRFRRWLSTQSAEFDRMRILVNGAVAWTNPTSGPVLEQAWGLQEVDLSSWADTNPSVRIEFELRTDGAAQLGGWNIDDVEIVRLGPASTGCSPVHAYGAGKLNSTGATGFLYGSGSPSFTTNQFGLYLGSVPPGRHAVLYSSAAPASTPLFGGLFLLAAPWAREIPWITTPAGDAWSDYPIAPAMVGTTRFYQAVFRDPAVTDGTGIGLSRGLRVDFCP